MPAFMSTSLKENAKGRTAIRHLALNEVTMKQHHPLGKKLKKRAHSDTGGGGGQDSTLERKAIKRKAASPSSKRRR